MSVTIICSWCNNEFIAKRPTAKFCCDSHKSLANRERRRLEEIEDERIEQENAFYEWQQKLEEEEKQRKDKAAAEQAALKLIQDEESKQRAEKQRIEKEHKRIIAEKRRKAENEKFAQKAEIKLKLYALGGLALYGLADKILSDAFRDKDKNKHGPGNVKSD